MGEAAIKDKFYDLNDIDIDKENKEGRWCLPSWCSDVSIPEWFDLKTPF